MSDKSELRRAALAARDAVSMTARIEASIALADHAEALEVEPGQTVAAYWPIRSEIDPRPLLFALHERGARMALPVVVGDDIAFRELTRTSELEPAGFGTMGPTAGAAEARPDLILAPLAGFDGAGNRLGYGRGFYDRAIEALRATGLAPRLVGLAHSAQRLDAIPAEPHDVPLDAVLTERGYKRFVR